MSAGLYCIAASLYEPLTQYNLADIFFKIEIPIPMGLPNWECKPFPKFFTILLL